MTTSNATVSQNLYPFISKAQIVTRLAEEPGFRLETMVILWTLQTTHEQATDTTLNRNKAGFMSSHAVHGGRIARKILAGEELSSEDMARVDSIAPRYSRQLACYFRAKAVEANPALKAVASLFSAG